MQIELSWFGIRVNVSQTSYNDANYKYLYTDLYIYLYTQNIRTVIKF